MFIKDTNWRWGRNENAYKKWYINQYIIIYTWRALAHIYFMSYLVAYRNLYKLWSLEGECSFSRISTASNKYYLINMNYAKKKLLRGCGANALIVPTQISHFRRPGSIIGSYSVIPVDRPIITRNLPVSFSRAKPFHVLQLLR